MKTVSSYGIAMYLRTEKSTKILLCKSISSTKKWGFLKGSPETKDKTRKATAQREFKEESGIFIRQRQFIKYFYQDNIYKYIGIFLVDGTDMNNLQVYFKHDMLKPRYSCDENDEVKFFNIKKLPPIKENQKHIVNEIIKYIK